MKCYMTGKACNYYKAVVQNQLIFIISPFGYPYDALYGDDGEVYNPDFPSKFVQKFENLVV